MTITGTYTLPYYINTSEPTTHTRSPCPVATTSVRGSRCSLYTM